MNEPFKVGDIAIVTNDVGHEYAKNGDVVKIKCVFGDYRDIVFAERLSDGKILRLLTRRIIHMPVGKQSIHE
jgi:hypothetical protein